GAGVGGDEDRLRPVPLQLEQRLRVRRVDLVDDEQLRYLVRPDLGQYRADRTDLGRRVRVGAVDPVHEQDGLGELRQRAPERLHQLVRQVPDETDRVGDGVVPAV